MSRSLVNVIQEAINEIPETEIKFIKQLKHNQRNVPFTAPELMYIKWDEIHSILWKYIPEKPTEEWHFKVLSVFSTKSVDELKKILN